VLSLLLVALSALIVFCSSLYINLDVGAQTTPRVEIFVTSWCPYCKLLERFLVSSKIPYIRQDIEKSRSSKLKHEELGGGGVPLTLVDGKLKIRGFNPVAILEALQKKAPSDNYALLSLRDNRIFP